MHVRRRSSCARIRVVVAKVLWQVTKLEGALIDAVLSKSIRQSSCQTIKALTLNGAYNWNP